MISTRYAPLVAFALAVGVGHLAAREQRARVNWLTIQVGNYSGRPTAAQSTWIAEYARQTQDVVASFDALRRTTLAALGLK